MTTIDSYRSRTFSRKFSRKFVEKIRFRTSFERRGTFGKSRATFGIFFVFVPCLFCSALSVRIESCVLFGVLFGGISRTLFCSVFCSRTSAVQSPAIPSSPQGIAWRLPGDYLGIAWGLPWNSLGAARGIAWGLLEELLVWCFVRCFVRHRSDVLFGVLFGNGCFVREWCFVREFRFVRCFVRWKDVLFIWPSLGWKAFVFVELCLGTVLLIWGCLKNFPRKAGTWNLVEFFLFYRIQDFLDVQTSG